MVQGIQDDSDEVGNPPVGSGVGVGEVPPFHCSTRRVPQSLKQKARMNQQLIAEFQEDGFAKNSVISRKPGPNDLCADCN